VSVFFRNKNVEGLKPASVEAFRFNVEQATIKMKTFDLLTEAEESTRDIQELLEAGELTEEEAQEEKALLVTEINKEKHMIENGPQVERLISSPTTTGRNVLSPHKAFSSPKKGGPLK